jgi:MFS family permease
VHRSKFMIVSYIIFSVGIILCGIIEFFRQSYVSPLAYGFTLCTFGSVVLTLIGDENNDSHRP